MKAITLLLALASGAGLVFRDQLQTWVHSPELGIGALATHGRATDGGYYLRTSFSFAAADKTVRWSSGQELRSAPGMAASQGLITLTDGVNAAQVPQTEVTRDLNEAVAIRERDAARQYADRMSSLAGGQSRTTLDEASFRAASRENVVSRASAPVFYYPSYSTIIVNRPLQIYQGGGGRATVVTRTPVPPKVVRPIGVPVPLSQ